MNKNLNQKEMVRKTHPTTKMSGKKIGCLGVIGILLLIGFIINLLEKDSKKPEIKESKKIEKSQQADTLHPHQTEEKERDPFSKMSPSEHLKIAKEEINKYDFKKGKMGSLIEAKRHLAAIPENSPEFKEVKKLDQILKS